MKHSIVFLDSGTIDLGDIDLSLLEKQGRLVLHRDTPPGKVVPRLTRADVVITNKCLLTSSILRKLPNLKLVCIAATGVNNIDVAAAREREIAVTNVAGYSTVTVAEQTLLFLLALSHRLIEHHNASVSGIWSRSPHFALLGFPFADLDEKVLGIVGYGKIGRQVARLARAFRMKILIGKIPGRRYGGGLRRASLQVLLQKSDFVSLHCPLSESTRHLINRRTLRLMKREAYLLNLARGPIVDEQAVASALKTGSLRGYATDVMEQEPPPRNHPFFQKSLRHKVLLSPHIAWASRESRQILINEIGQNIASFLSGKKRNRIV